MQSWQRALALAASLLTIACLLPAYALASSSEQSILMDDDQLIYSPPDHVVSVMRTLHALGVDEVKVSVVWQLVAPDGTSNQRPDFDATNPSAYPPGAWDRYDLIAEEARALGMKAYFQLDPPVPDWAIPSDQATQGPRLGLAPNMSEFEQFVQAIGERYSGSYVEPTSQSGEEAGTLPSGIPGIGASAPSQDQQSPPPLPRVSIWGVWNEPNERSWLSPIERNLGHGHTEYLQPVIYRQLVDAAWQGLSATGHSADTFLVGETANAGILTPGSFIRDLFCVAPATYRPLRGVAAEEAGCPTSGGTSQFVQAHPGLFRAAGFAHHPYGFDYAPNRPYPDRNYLTLQNISLLERILEHVFDTYGQGRHGGIPLYLTEWGYKTNPPNPYVKTSLAEQATWLNQGEFMTWQLPYVKALAQFLLVDDKPKAHEAVGSQDYWSTFQTGLETTGGQLKPSFSAFQLPLWVPDPRHGSRVTVWGQLRPAEHGATQYGEIEFRPAHASSWENLREVETNSAEGFVVAHLAISTAGQLRLAWLTPDGSVEVSRTVSIS
jgi:hypothetical protein